LLGIVLTLLMLYARVTEDSKLVFCMKLNCRTVVCVTHFTTLQWSSTLQLTILRFRWRKVGRRAFSVGRLTSWNLIVTGQSPWSIALRQ